MATEAQVRASQKYAQSQKGREVQKKIRESDQNKQLKKEWRSKGGHAAEYERNKDKYRDTYMKRVYGISLEEYNVMLAEQQGVCKVCSRPPALKALAIDHCHTTGKVRGVLCHYCNTALGSVNDSVETLMKLINYLEQQK